MARETNIAGAAGNWGTPPWTVDIPVPPAPPPAHADVFVVGAGLTGLSAAYHLRRARPNWRVAILESGRAASGASGRTGGLMLEDTAGGKAEGFSNCLDSLAELVAREKIDCRLLLNGCWEISHSGGNASSAIQWNDDGTPLRSDSLVAGGTADPGRLVSGVAQAALRAGATLHEQCEVLSMDFGDPVELHTAKLRVRGRHVVICTNAYSFHLSGLKDRAVGALAIGMATMPLPESAIAALGLADLRPFYTKDLPYLWGRMTPERSLVLGSGLLPFEPGVTLESTAARLLFAGLERRVRGFHPVLRDVNITHHWAGPICITRDHFPIVERHAKSDRVLFAGGYSGHGLAQAIRAGKLLCDQIAN